MRPRTVPCPHAPRFPSRPDAHTPLAALPALRRRYFEWERKGVPLRVDIGPRDVASGETKMSRRTDSAKVPLALADPAAAAEAIVHELEDMQAGLLRRARERVQANTYEVQSYGEMAARLNGARHRTALPAALCCALLCCAG